MLEKFLKQTSFGSYEGFMANFELIVPDNFKFGYDVVDAWAEQEPDRVALRTPYKSRNNPCNL